jgi:hypothetical protein
MILVGIPIHGPSIRYLKNLLEVWGRWNVDVDLLAVYNGPISKDAIRAARAVCLGFTALSVKLVIQPTGHFSGYGSLRNAQSYMRQVALEGTYTHLLFNEVTRLPKEDTFRQVVDSQKPVAGALYKDSYNPGYYCVFDVK